MVGNYQIVSKRINKNISFFKMDSYLFRTQINHLHKRCRNFIIRLKQNFQFSITYYRLYTIFAIINPRITRYGSQEKLHSTSMASKLVYNKRFDSSVCTGICTETNTARLYQCYTNLQRNLRRARPLRLVG